MKLKNLGIFTLTVLLYIVFMTITGIGCPIRWFTGISCPGCGMSCAFISLLRLDFAAAFRYHPMIYLPYYFLGSEKTPRRRKLKKFFLAVVIIMFFFVWIFRIFHEDSVVRIDPANGVMIKYLKRGILRCT